MNRLFAFLVASMFAMQISFAQFQEQFSTNPNEFLGQFEIFMTSSKREVLIESYKKFEKTFNSGAFTPPEVDTIIAMSNKMLGLRMTASPFFENYLAGLQLVKKSSEFPEQQFLDWHKILSSILADIENKNTKTFGSFLDFSKYFFENQTLRYSKIGTSWLARNAKYVMKYEQKQPIIEFQMVDLLASRKQDSLRIVQTQGQYFPATEKWIGKNGRVNWSDRFPNEIEVYAEFRDTFSIDLNTGLYKVQNALLYYPSYFGSKLIAGSFEDKVTGRGEDAPYPSFESKESVLKIDKIAKGVYYTGGFKLNGLTIYGYGTKQQRASLEIYDEKETRLLYRGASELVIIKKGETLIGERVESALYYEKDSIYHPSVNIRFNIPKRELQLNRGQRGSDRNPFFSSAHRITIETENLVAYLAKDSIAIGKRGIAMSARPEVSFESLKYYNESTFLKAQNIAEVNPLVIMAITAEKEGTRKLDANLIAKRINAKYTPESMQSMMYELMAQGFVNYDADAQIIYVKDKLIHYAKANQKRVDYDGLKILSVSDSTNATLNLKTNEISVSGVDAIEFSRLQKVAIVPDKKKITIKQNRDMSFDGKLFAGYSVMYGKGFQFNYDKYNINLDSVEYFDLYLPSGKLDERNQPEAISIGSRIEGLNGVLLIDAPSNKSGKEDIEIFPSFQSKENSFVYYEKPEIQEGVYKRDSFYFLLDKFSFNHLDKLTARDVRFKGKLISADIFTPFEEELVVRNTDQSLGFEHNTKGNGYALYKEKGNYKGLIDLSNKGLLGKGDLTYLGAKFYSEDIAFLPYQLKASAKTFNHTENNDVAVNVPQVEGIDVKIDWRPYKDSMYVKSDKAPFDLFTPKQHTLLGTVIVSPGGIKGIGTLDWAKAEMKSPLFNFGAFTTQADTTTINIKSADKIALGNANVAANVDFGKEKGYFKANNPLTLTTLPYNQYATSMNEFEWDMKEQKVQFKSEVGKFGRFLSVHPEQDSLEFKGQDALYNIANNELYIKGVPYIFASDAFIYPDSGLVKVLPNAKITTLENARIVADTLNKNHVINRATVNIKGKRVYEATGYYEYNIGGREQEITFQDIQGRPVGKGSAREKQSITRATGTVSAKDSFYIDSKTRFQGTISLSAESKNLQFDGFAKLEAERLFSQHWFRVRFEGDKRDLRIRYKEPKDEDGTPLETGFFLSRETARAYPSIMAPLPFRKDRPVLEVRGVLDYEEKRDIFIFADSIKMYNPTALKGNYLAFNNATGKVSGEGKFGIGSGLKYVSAKTAGTIQTEIPTDSLGEYVVTAEVMAAIDLIVPQKLLDIMVKDFAASSYEAKPINFIQEPIFYKKAVAELFEMSKELQTTIDGINLGSFNLPGKQNNHTFVFAKLPLKWNPDYQSFVTQGSRIGLSTIQGQLFNHVYTGYVEFRMPSNGDDRLYIYLESASGNGYYYGYNQGILSVTSTNTQFMDAADELKAKDVVLKMKDGETYEIQIVNPSQATLFVNRAKAAQ